MIIAIDKALKVKFLNAILEGKLDTDDFPEFFKQKGTQSRYIEILRQMANSDLGE
ncbi:MAG: hypothetical protein WC910_06335 [Bacteroidales bacterium]|jgi:hypothetical protein|nr:hypothetical protein [Bacteroidales bacterium]MDD3945856.1 hypothetical protein [Bacteroidales bacterium]MDD4499756.1 hypothetical protein [Bacteroidales bacterium]OQC56940.1 MAG: hypothetical protein BWX52_01367 [Bacteroidetes bacterium ADurb.Bin013]HHV02686.1 hypothetical protein [Bacteroidales bacterium]